MSELEVLGLSPEECTAYEFLVDSPPLTRAELEDGLTRLGEAGAGRSLAALEDRGLVTTWAGDPARFAAVAPDVALDNLARMREQDLVRARAHAQTLADRWSRVGRAVDPREMIEIVVGRAATLQRAEQIQRTSIDEVLMFDKPPYAAPGIGNPTELDLLGAGTTRFRCIYDTAGLDLPGQYRVIEELREAGEESRVARSLPMKMVMGDARIALVPLETSPEVIEVAAVVHPSALLESLHTLFELLWQRSEQLGGLDREAPGHARFPEPDRQVLDLLTAGLTDRAVARQLGVTERTVQRRVQRIMTQYGVRTRLQLGLRLSSGGPAGSARERTKQRSTGR
ncbi:MAG: helix-turn-helix domain-containing protein [Nocardioides sp.]